ncbi:DUF4198 domain-containing protein [Primorskyibacter aestuariivivens]|uniref:DUF4198 domain-containing protein n=1 Tax=Primorskyibacter aestuariivivens TaxID=1888912 RepID=UPI0022FFF95C|nr:DUF4198 domain-containing protein [Primorskyibacter aestuariivivens]MDA7429653.1 DUF4198 domain-containing protein [Primorskyibacter aestuariivivens]
MFRPAAIFTLATLFPAAVSAHEFWIDAKAWQVAPDAPIVADIRVGEEFKGSAYSYLPPRFRRFDIVQGDDVTAVEGRAGDRPALNMAAPAEGLAVVVHVTSDYSLTYSEWDKFVNFATHKDWVPLIEEHEARGLPETGFRERYSRHGKSLIAVGEGTGMDREVGLETEIVALANPYTDDLSGGLPVRVLYQGAPRGNAQVELFEKAPDGSVATSLHRTDADGMVQFPVKPGHTYLVDAVVLRPLEPVEESDPVWESLWASLTFQVPE